MVSDRGCPSMESCHSWDQGATAHAGNCCSFRAESRPKDLGKPCGEGPAEQNWIVPSAVSSSSPPTRPAAPGTTMTSATAGLSCALVSRNNPQPLGTDLGPSTEASSTETGSSVKRLAAHRTS